MLLFPCDPLRRGRPDPHFADEYAAARDVEIPVALINHDAAAAGSFDESCEKVSVASGLAIYRGWMLRTPVYAGFERALSERGVTLKTTASNYEKAHHCSEAGCACIAPLVERVGNEVHWSDFQNFTGVYSTPKVEPSPNDGKKLPIPTLRFDSVAYEAAVRSGERL